MTAIALVTRAAIRRQWRGLVVVALLVGIAGAVVLTAAAGARRTSTSLERFQQYSRSGDLEIDLRAATARQIDELRRNPAVRGVGVLHQFTVNFPNGQLVPLAAAIDATFGTVVDRPRVIKGRLPRPTSVHELAVSETLAAQLHVRVGDNVSFDSDTVAQTRIGATGANPGPPAGPKVRFHVVGLTRLPLDLGVRGALGGVVVPTPAFYERYRNVIGSFVDKLLRVRGAHGAADVPKITKAARRIFGDSFFGVVGVGDEADSARDAINVLTVALWIFAGVAALAGLTAVGIVTIRQIANEERDQEILAALGLTAGQRALAAGTLALPAALGGAAVAVMAAALMSPLLPFGVAGKAEVDPGFRFDGLVLGGGFVAVIAFVLLVASIAAWRVARSLARDRALRGAMRPSAAARAAANAGATPTLTAGMRMALERGRGPTAVPIRSAFFGAALGTLGIVAVLVFGASLDHLVATPRLYGWSWDTSVTSNRPIAAGKPCGAITTNLTHDPAVAAVASICLENFQVDGHPLTGFGFTSLRGSITPSIVEGRASRTSNEITLGSTTLEAIGKHIGDTVQVRGGTGTKRFRIVGQVVIPTLSSDDPEPLADDAAVTGAGFARLFPVETAPDMYVVARFAPGVNVARLQRTASGQVKLQSGVGTLPTVAVEVDRLRQIDNLPAILGGLLGLLATVAVAHAIVLAIRRRRRELAVLRTIGFERRDVRATVAYQATILGGLGLVVGVPAGIVVGRVVWDAVARGLGVASEVNVPVLAVALVAVGVVAVANIIGVLAARAAIHDRPAVVLSGE